jgi:hypothetical protein
LIGENDEGCSAGVGVASSVAVSMVNTSPKLNLQAKG